MIFARGMLSRKQESSKNVENQPVEKSIRLSPRDFPLYPRANNTLVQLWPGVSGTEFDGLPNK